MTATEDRRPTAADVAHLKAGDEVDANSIGLVVTGLMWAHLREKAHECMGGGGSDA